jgi:hypothetical protein
MRAAVTMTRRTALGLGLLVVSACKHKTAPRPPALPPDASALGALTADEMSMLAATTDPAEFAMHVQHYVALGGSATDYPAPPEQSDAAPRPLLKRSAAALRQAAVNAVDGTHAATFASIAASHEVMLRG